MNKFKSVKVNERFIVASLFHSPETFVWNANTKDLVYRHSVFLKFAFLQFLFYFEI